MTNRRTHGDITIRPLTQADVASLYHAIRVSLDSLSRTLLWCHAGYSLQDAEQWIAYCESSWANQTAFPFGIFDANGAVVGGAGISHVDRTCNKGNIGYWISERCRGMGVASTAARLVAEVGFSELGFTRLEIVVLANNVASNRVALNIGATLEADARNRLVSGGKPVSAFVYSLVPEDILGS